MDTKPTTIEIEIDDITAKEADDIVDSVIRHVELDLGIIVSDFWVNT